MFPTTYCLYGNIVNFSYTSRIQKYTQKAIQTNGSENNRYLPFPMWTPSNTPISRPIPLTYPNGIRIQSVVLPQYIIQTDRQTDRWARQQACKNTRLGCIKLYSDATNYTQQRHATPTGAVIVYASSASC